MNQANPHETWAVVVVHGVGGGGQPGATLDDFLKPLLAANPDARLAEPPEVRMLKPDAVAGETEAQRFPAHFREYEFPSARAGTPQKAVFAEVFWGDLSATRAGVLQLLMRLFTMVFDLSFVADQAASVHGLWGVRWLRSGLYLMSWLLCGPIAACHALFLYLLVVYYVDRLLASSADGIRAWLTPQLLPWEVVTLGATLTGVGLVYAWVSWRRLKGVPRWKASWLLGSLVVTILGLVLLAGFAWLAGLSKEDLQEKIDTFTRDFLPWWALRLGGVLTVVSAGLLLLSWRHDWGSPWLLAFWTAACAGIGLVVCFWTAAFLGKALTEVMPHAQMLGCGAAAFLFAGGLWVWGSVRREPWNRVWLILYLNTGLAALALFCLAAYRLQVAPAVYDDSPLAKLIRERVPLAQANLSVFTSYLAALLCLLRASFFVLGIVGTFTLLAWAATHLECWLRGRFPRLRPAGLGDYHYARAHPGLAAAYAATLLQVGLWVIIVPALAALAVQRLAPDLAEIKPPADPVLGAFLGAAAAVTAENIHLFSSVWTQYAFHLMLALVVFVGALAIWVWRWFWVHWAFYEAAPAAKLVTARGIARLIASWWWILLPLIAVSIVGTAQFCWSFWRGESQLPAGVLEWLNANAPKIIAGAVAGITLIFLLFREGLLAALHVITDVISHFHRPRQQNPLKLPGPTLERGELDEFRIQRRIEARARRVLEEVFKDKSVRRLTVVTHSQGTIIAIHTLYQGSTLRLFQANQLPNGKACLITMGSPFTHLYQHYIARRYPSLFLNSQFHSKGWYAFRQTVGPWLNVFRVDDFVGTHIDGNGTDFPEDIVLTEAGGHTNYWGNQETFEQIRGELPGT